MPAEGPVHIVEVAYWGEESAGGSVNVELRAFCGANSVHDSFKLLPEAPVNRLICQECHRRFGYFQVDQTNF